jgi:tetratricopeptide (TPR) repeat protein
MTAKRFRVAFSFAGEKRDFVKQVAEILARRFGEAAILYDKYHAAEFSRGDLAFYLADLYETQADLVVAVLCSDYDPKEWCGLEWNAIFGLLKKRRTEEVMLTRFGQVEGKGLRGLAGYTDLDGLTPEQAATMILERLAVNEGRSKDFYTRTGTVRPHIATTTPNNLPRLQPFFGREKELAAVRDALDPESRTWGALIDGPGGMGKTSLAVRAAYDCPPDQFERIIFVSVKDRELDDDGERKLTGFILPGFLEMLNELAREFGQPDITKAPEDQRIRLLLDALRPVRALLILDNLESLSKDDRDQLFTFVKRLPQGCKAILTSRRRIGSGSELLILEKLDEEAALETLAELSEHNKLLARTTETERRALARQTGGNPLLLRWVAGQLGRGSCRTLSDGLVFLRSCPADNDPLEFVFGDLAREFTDAETRVLAALSFFTLPARVTHIAELLDVRAEPVETALRTLANRSLVVPDQEELSYTLIPMIAEFLRRSRPGTIAETSDRLMAHVYSMVLQNGHNNPDRFPVLDTAWPTVAAAFPLIMAQEEPVIQEMCSALGRFLNYSGRWDEWLSLNQQAEAYALAAGDLLEAGWNAYHAGHVHALRGQANAVLDCAERAAKYFETSQAGENERSMAAQLRVIGHHLKKDYASAISACEEALELERSISPEGEGVAVALNDLARTRASCGDYAGAERDFREALRIAILNQHEEMMAGIPGNLAAVMAERGAWSEAESLAREALQGCEKLGRQDLIAANLYHLGLALLSQGRAGEALPYARRAVDIAVRLEMLEAKKFRMLLFNCQEETENEQQTLQNS